MKKLLIAFTLMAAVVLTGCEKDKEPDPVLASVTTIGLTNITTTSAQSGGSVESKGREEVLEKGIVWSTSQNPVYGDEVSFMSNEGAGTGTFSTTMTNLTPGATYYVRAYARNEVGIAYGNELSFNTTGLSLPTVFTGDISSITNNSALCSGTVLEDGNTEIIERGICWSTEIDPTIYNYSTTAGAGVGEFKGVMTCDPNTRYYVRAYATNSIGTSYGEQQSFTSLMGIGDPYKGGVIAYMLEPGDEGYSQYVPHGLIAAVSDQSAGVPWSITYTTTGATDKRYGAGQENTNAITNDQGAGSYAAKLCENYGVSIYTDWYLPSAYELEKLYENREAIGGFEVAFYWSSSEENSNSAWMQSFNSNSQAPGTKTDMYRVRAVRTF